VQVLREHCGRLAVASAIAWRCGPRRGGAALVAETAVVPDSSLSRRGHLE